ncbi:MAG: glycoside hydrolase family 127 protein [Ignavibacteriales bacterium]|nr:glycoside hydrolase family 127 protein [Ignavibacteriales bacterium]
MKKIILFFCIAVSLNIAQERKLDFPDYPIGNVDIRNVKLTDDFWLPKIKLVQNTTVDYAFRKCEEEGRVENFLIAGGKKEGKFKGKMPFDDTDIYKIIEGASYSLVSQPNPVLEKYIDSLINIIGIGQEPDGYLTTWFTIDRDNPPAAWVKPSKVRWGSEDASHELYNSGHMFEAAAAHYWATGKRNFLDIAIKNADLLVNNFGPNKLKTPPGHQIVETGLIKLYHITQNKKYLELAKMYLESRGDSTTHKLYGEYSQDHIPVLQQEEAVGHSVRALYMYAGMTDIAAIYKDQKYLNAINKIWENATDKKMYITGGMGSKHGAEAFGENYELPNLTGYNETCAAIGNIYWNHRLFLLTGNSKYFDIIERTLYNGMISGISLDGKNFFYPNPTESDGEYKFNMGSCTRSPWFDCSCCPTNIIRFIPSIPGLIYGVNNDSLYINLFIGNKADVKIDNEKVKVEQITNYPWNGKIKINIEVENPKEFTLKIRIPGWAINKPVPGNLYKYVNHNNNKIKLLVNGKEENLNLVNGYAVVSKVWSKRENVELNIPMEIKKVEANENVKDDSGKVAIEFGPIVYCAEEADNKIISNITIDDATKLNANHAVILDQPIVEINGENENFNFSLIPYYIWSNRGVNKMKVWFRVTN